MNRLALTIAILGVALCATGCQGPKSRLNAPPHGETSNSSRLSPMYAHMVDNALLTDMALSDCHFHPHRATLNALGEDRLARLASLMEVHGGEIRLNTDLTDEDLIQERMNTVVAFLGDAGLDTYGELVRQDLPGSTGMDAIEAILIKEYEATYQPPQQGIQ